MTNSATHWRRVGLVGACLVVGSICWSIFSKVAGPSRSESTDESEVIDLDIFKKNLSPTEVVALQVKAIRNSVNSPDELKICYSLASPQNREVTGPFAKFAQMIMMPPYDQLATSREWQVSDSKIENDNAVVLVSTVSAEGDVTAFRFLLHQYKREPYAGCWLTEGVHVLKLGEDSPEDSSNPKP